MIERMQGLDAARGLACFAIVTYHWERTSTVSAFSVPEWVAPFYWRIPFTVDLFFAISGFVLATIYRNAIAAGSLTGPRYAWLRFSRMYPLHIATFALTACLLWLGAPNLFGASSGAGTATLNILFLQGFGPTSFNHPAWSITMEAVAYAVFFFAAPRLERWSVAMIMVGVLISPVFDPLSRGLIGFFAGALATRLSERTAAAIMLSGIALAAATYGAGFKHLAVLLIEAAAIPPLVRLVAFRQAPRAFIWLGEISYSVYLLHVPLMMLTTAVALTAHIPVQALLLPYLAATLAIATVSYRCLERPAERWLRSWNPPVRRWLQAATPSSRSTNFR